MSLGTILIVLAAVAGPVAAVLLLLHGLERDRGRQRKLDLLLSMLQHRRLWLSPEWVGGLNLVLIEFADQPTVIEALNKLIDGYSHPGWQGNEKERQRLILDTEANACGLLVRMAAALKFELKMSDLRSRAFTPIGWSADDVQARHQRDMLQMVLGGVRPLRVELSAPLSVTQRPAQAPQSEPVPAPQLKPGDDDVYQFTLRETTVTPP